MKKLEFFPREKLSISRENGIFRIRVELGVVMVWLEKFTLHEWH